MSTGRVDTAEVTVVSVLPVVDLDPGEPPPSLELISCSGRRVSADCRGYTHTHKYTHTAVLVCGIFFVCEVKNESFRGTYGNALIVRNVHPVGVFCKPIKQEAEYTHTQ